MRLRRLLLAESVENQPVSTSHQSVREQILLPVNQRFLPARPASESLQRL